MDALIERRRHRHDIAGNADQQRHFEKFERADEGEQQHGQYARTGERQRHAPEALPPARARHGGRLLERRIHGAERRQREQKGDRCPEQAFDEYHAAEAEQFDRRAGEAEPCAQPYVDQPVVGAEQQDPADPAHDQRRGERQERTDEDSLAKRHIGARHEPRGRKAEHDGENRRTERKTDRDAPQAPAVERQNPPVILPPECRLEAGHRNADAALQKVEERRQDNRGSDGDDEPDDADAEVEIGEETLPAADCRTELAGDSVVGHGAWRDAAERRALTFLRKRSPPCLDVSL